MIRHRNPRSASRPILLAALALATVGAFAAANLAGVRPAEAQRSSRSDARGFLGVRLQDLDDRLRDSYEFKGNGVLVSDVTPGSPADRVGIEDGDILTKIGDRAVTGAAQATDIVRALRPGELVGIEVVRDGDKRYLGRAEIGDLSSVSDDDAPIAPRARRAPRAMAVPPAPEALDAPDVVRRFEFGPGMKGMRAFEFGGRGRLGIEPHDLDADMGPYFQAPDGHGVLVLDVLDDTPAAAAGLKAGDVIRSVGGTKVDDTDDLRRVLGEQKAGRVDVGILRRGSAQTIAVELKEPEGSFDFRSLPGAGDWMGWLDDGDDHGNPGDGRMHVYRFKSDGKEKAPRVRVYRNFDDLPDGDDRMSPEEREKFEADMRQLREDMRELRRQLREMNDQHGR